MNGESYNNEKTIPLSGEGPVRGRSKIGRLNLPCEIRNYELYSALGAGGMGEVFLARHKVFRKKKYAVKLIRSGLLIGDARIRFQNEIVAMGDLDHPNIVGAIDTGEVNGEPFLVMEYVDGIDAARIGRQYVSIADACEIARQAANGLQYAFENGYVHRDLKPANLIISKTGTVKLLDLGLVKLLGGDRSAGLTQTGVYCGTPDFMAPEQWDDASSVSTRSDIYSLGCTLYCLLTGQPPYGSLNTMSQKMCGHVSSPLPDPKVLRSEIPNALVNVLSKSLAKSADDRFQTPLEFAEVLQEFADGHDLAKVVKNAGLEPSEPNSESENTTAIQKHPTKATKFGNGTQNPANEKTPIEIPEETTTWKIINWLTIIATAIAIIFISYHGIQTLNEDVVESDSNIGVHSKD